MKRMYDLMRDSIFMPFLNSFAQASRANPSSHAHTFSHTASDFGGRHERGWPMSTSAFEDREDLGRLHPSSTRRGSPPSSSGMDFSGARSSVPSNSHRRAHSSSITSALGGGPPGSRLSTHVSNSSAVSGQECGLTDDSGSASADSPSTADPMTPPTTPPGSEPSMGALPALSSSHSGRSDSGSWKRVGMRLLRKRRNGGRLRERSDEG